MAMSRVTSLCSSSVGSIASVEEKSIFIKRLLQCSICLGTFKEPVTTSCGHNFCQMCLLCHWNHNDQNCPLCKKFLFQEPKVNVGLRDITQEFKKAQERRPEDCRRNIGEVPCDVCLGERKPKAVKSCLVCLISYCQEHLKLHTTARRLHGHKLVAPVSNLDIKACLDHGRPLELYCRDEEKCICTSCNHTGHNVVIAEEESGRKKVDLESKKKKLQLKMNERKDKLKDIQLSVSHSKVCIDSEYNEIKAAFEAIMDVVLQAQKDALGPLEEKQKDVERQAQELTQELQEEIEELADKISDLDRMTNDPDHIHFLQNFQLPEPKSSKDWSLVSVDTKLSLGSMRGILSTMMEKINQQLEDLSTVELKRIKTFAVDVTLDPNTANPQLIISNNKKEVRDSGTRQDLPDSPERFDLFGSVLGSSQLCSGRYYWEVDVGDKTGWDLGVARESINRKGQLKVNPHNGYWVIVLSNGDKFALDESPIRLAPISTHSRIGVYVDYEEGLVSFYDIQAESHLYSFTGCAFTEKLYPYFSPHLSQNNKNNTPLVITPI